MQRPCDYGGFCFFSVLLYCTKNKVLGLDQHEVDYDDKYSIDKMPEDYSHIQLFTL